MEFVFHLVVTDCVNVNMAVSSSGNQMGVFFIVHKEHLL